MPKTAVVKKRKGYARRIGVESDASYDERKLIVLRAAALEFVRNGIENTSINEIARQLNVKKPTIYHYGGSKDELVQECLKVGSDQLTAFLDELVKRKLSGLDKLQLLFRMYARHVAEDFGRLFVIVNPRTLSPAGLSDYTRARRRFVDVIRQLLREGQADGSVAVDDPHLASFTLLGAINFVGSWYRPGGKYSSDEVFEGMMTLFLNGIRGPAHAGGAAHARQARNR